MADVSWFACRGVFVILVWLVDFVVLLRVVVWFVGYLALTCFWWWLLVSVCCIGGVVSFCWCSWVLVFAVCCCVALFGGFGVALYAGSLIVL